MLGAFSVDLVRKQVKLLKLSVVLDCGLELLEKLVIHMTAVKSERLQFTFVFERLQELLADFLELFQVIMSEEEVCQSCVGGETTCEEAKGVLAHLVVAHVNLLDVSICFQSFSNWFNLRVSQLILEQV